MISPRKYYWVAVGVVFSAALLWFVFRPPPPPSEPIIIPSTTTDEPLREKTKAPHNFKISNLYLKPPTLHSDPDAVARFRYETSGSNPKLGVEVSSMQLRPATPFYEYRADALPLLRAARESTITIRRGEVTGMLVRRISATSSIGELQIDMFHPVVSLSSSDVPLGLPSSEESSLLTISPWGIEIGDTAGFMPTEVVMPEWHPLRAVPLRLYYTRKLGYLLIVASVLAEPLTAEIAVVRLYSKDNKTVECGYVYLRHNEDPQHGGDTTLARIASSHLGDLALLVDKAEIGGSGARDFLRSQLPLR